LSGTVEENLINPKEQSILSEVDNSAYEDNVVMEPDSYI
jgi:hypothetical protein